MDQSSRTFLIDVTLLALVMLSHCARVMQYFHKQNREVILQTSLIALLEKEINK